MATTHAQRIGIWIIAGALTLGTIGSFLIIILANDNQATEQARIDQLTSAYQKEYEEYTTKVQAQATALSKKYYDDFKIYNSRADSFDKDVAKLQTKDLKIGTGDEIKADTSFTAYYIGWNPSGKVFDSSIEGKALKAPITAASGVVIEGWTEGAVGMRVGGVRELTIPADLAYGEAGSGEDIPANTPLKFIIMVIPTPEEIAQPQPSEELIRYYSQ